MYVNLVCPLQKLWYFEVIWVCLFAFPLKVVILMMGLDEKLVLISGVFLFCPNLSSVWEHYSNLVLYCLSCHFFSRFFNFEYVGCSRFNLKGWQSVIWLIFKKFLIFRFFGVGFGGFSFPNLICETGLEWSTEASCVWSVWWGGVERGAATRWRWFCWWRRWADNIPVQSQKCWWHIFWVFRVSKPLWWS